MMGLNPTLYLYKNHKVLFSNMGSHLEPLVELNNFISRYVQNREGMMVYDKTVGKANAVLLNRIGIKHVKADTMSESARLFFEEHNIEYEYKKLVPRINSKLEDAIEGIDNPQDVYNYLLANHLI